MFLESVLGRVVVCEYLTCILLSVAFLPGSSISNAEIERFDILLHPSSPDAPKGKITRKRNGREIDWTTDTKLTEILHFEESERTKRRLGLHAPRQPVQI